MSQEPENEHKQPVGEVDLEAVKREFITYLDGKVAPLFVAEALSQMLRVAPPIYFEPKQVADLVAAWAQTRINGESKPVHEYYLKSIELIVTADRTGVLTGFKPSGFYMPYFEGLLRNCPAKEREIFREKTKQLCELLDKQWSYDFRRDEFEQTAVVVSNSVKRRRPPDELKAIIAKLQTPGLRLTGIEEQELISDLQRAIEGSLREPGFSILPSLETLVGIAITFFNADQPLFGAELLGVVQQVYNSGGVDRAARDGLRRCKSASDLNSAQLKMLVNKPELRDALNIFLSHFDELCPYGLLTALANEKDRQQRRFLTALIEVQSDTAAPVIMDLLSKMPPIVSHTQNWFFARNLIYLLGRVAPQDLNDQQTAINLIGPYLHSPVFQLRIAALGSLENFTIEEVVELVLPVFNETSYIEEHLNNQERLSTYLSSAISLVSRFNSETTLRLLVEIATGERFDFLLEKLERPLRLQALQALASKRKLLSPTLVAPLIECIRRMTRWKILFLSRLLGEDEQLLLAMVELVASTPTPQAIQVVTDIKARYAKKPLGRRSSELLNYMYTQSGANQASGIRGQAAEARDQRPGVRGHGPFAN